MPKLKIGFSGERCVFIPQTTVDLVGDDHITSDLYIHSLGHFTKAKYHYIERECGCPEYIYIFCKDGCGIVVINDQEYRLVENTFIIIPANTKHIYAADTKTPWTIYWIHFKGTKARWISKGFDKPTSIPYLVRTKIEDILSVFDEMYVCLSNSIKTNALNYANMCLNYFFAPFLFADEAKNIGKNNQFTLGTVNRLVYFMNENICKHLVIDDFMQFTGYSRSYLNRAFVKATSVTPMYYFTRLKVNKACMLLINTNMKINEIAMMLCFSNQYHFSRIFTKFMDMSPSNFRNEQFRIISKLESYPK